MSYRLKSDPEFPLLTRDELASTFGQGATKSIYRKARSAKKLVVPNADDLRIGDVILCRPKSGDANKPHQIERHQSTIPRLAVADAPSWRHAMLYVGRLHVAESTTLFKTREGIVSGVRIAPLVNVDEKTEYLVRRRLVLDDNFDEYRQAAAMFALTDFALSRKTYGFDRIAKMALSELKLLPKVLAKVAPTNFEKSLICSEYVLQCLAIGGQILTPEWLSLDDSNFFYPADFAIHPTFESIPVTFKQLTL